jgi:hypothetical protein
MGLVIGPSIDAYDFHLLSPQLRLSNLVMTPSPPGVCTPAAGYHKPLAHTILSSWSAGPAAGRTTVAATVAAHATIVYDSHRTAANISRGASNDPGEQTWTFP